MNVNNLPTYKEVQYIGRQNELGIQYHSDVYKRQIHYLFLVKLSTRMFCYPSVPHLLCSQPTGFVKIDRICVGCTQEENVI